MSIASTLGGHLERPASGGLSEIVGMILDKGLVIDAFVRVSLVGIEVLTVEAKIVVASIDTYLRYAESMARLQVVSNATQSLPGIVQGVVEGVTKGALDAVQHSIEGTLQAAEQVTGIVPVTSERVSPEGPR